MTFSQSPDPCIRGQKVTFCLDIEGLSLPITASGAWDASGGAEIGHTITSSSDRCWDEDVPSDATGGYITAPGLSEFAVSVKP